jgi:hypothetical protein
MMHKMWIHKLNSKVINNMRFSFGAPLINLDKTYTEGVFKFLEN